jgi:hypothetical protein
MCALSSETIYIIAFWLTWTIRTKERPFSDLEQRNILYLLTPIQPVFRECTCSMQCLSDRQAWEALSMPLGAEIESADVPVARSY